MSCNPTSLYSNIQIQQHGCRYTLDNGHCVYGWENQKPPTQLQAKQQVQTMETNTSSQDEPEDILPIHRLSIADHQGELEDIPIYKLPGEVIRSIATHLPVASAAALSLCSYHLLDVLGQSYLQQCHAKGQGDNRHALLELLSRSMNGYIACHPCFKLHRVDFPFDVPRQCTVNDTDNTVSTIIFPHLFFIHIQMAMKLHLIGLDPSPYLAPMTTGSDTYMHMPGVPIGNLLEHIFNAPPVTHTPRIHAGELLFRSQFCLLMPWSTLDAFENIWRVADTDLSCIQLCKHLSMLDARLIMQFTRQCIHVGRGTPRCSGCHELLECTHCGTQFMIEIQHYGSRGVAFVLTRWMNLGAGRSQFEEKWARVFEYVRYPGLRLAEGDTMTRFEGCKPNEFCTVLSESQESVLFAHDEREQRRAEALARATAIQEMDWATVTWRAVNNE